MTLALLVINLVVFGYYGEYESRIMRFLSMVVFFLVFLRPGYYSRRALLIFVAFVFNDLLLIAYEIEVNQNLILLIRLCAFLLLARLVLPYLRKIKVKIFEGVLFIAVLIINLFLLYYIKDSIFDEQSGWLEDLLFYGYGTAIIISVSAAFTFFSRYFDKASIFFLLSLIGFVMSDLTFFIGFYLDFSEFYYLDRGFNVLAVGFLLHFIFLFQRKIARGFYEEVGDRI